MLCPTECFYLRCETLSITIFWYENTSYKLETWDKNLSARTILNKWVRRGEWGEGQAALEIRNEKCNIRGDTWQPTLSITAYSLLSLVDIVYKGLSLVNIKQSTLEMFVKRFSKVWSITIEYWGRPCAAQCRARPDTQAQGRNGIFLTRTKRDKRDEHNERRTFQNLSPLIFCQI